MPRPRRPMNRLPSGARPPAALIREAPLIGTGGVEALRKSTVFVIGLGGVGSWAAEYLARSGVGRLMLFDPDRVEESNINRQRQARPSTLGRPKAQVLAEEIKVHEWQEIRAFREFMDGEKLLSYVMQFSPDVIVEAVDNVTAKASMIALARRENLVYFTSLGAASRLDPTQIRTDDLARTSVCPLGKDLRKVLRRKHGFPGEDEGPFGITAVYSLEKPWKSEDDVIRDGSYVPVTAAFGAALAYLAIRKLALPESLSPDSEAGKKQPV